MSHTIVFRGAPIGSVELPTVREARSIVAVHALPSYAVLSPMVRAASAALRQMVPSGSASDAVDTAADTPTLAAAAMLGRTLALHDAAGEVVPTLFIELFEQEDVSPPLLAVIGWPDEGAGVPAELAPDPRHLRDSQAPPA